MKITIKATKITLTPSIRRRIETAFGKLDKFAAGFAESAEMWVEIGKTTRHHKSGEVWRAEANLRVPRKILRAQALRLDLYIAITEAREELIRQILKYRDTHFLSVPKSSKRSYAARRRGKL